MSQDAKKPSGSSGGPPGSRPSERPFHNPFAGLEALKSSLPPGKPKAEPKEKLPARAVIRLERSGRGGKEVTVVSHLELEVAKREKWLKDLKTGLGCGGQVEGDTLVLQGDMRERAKTWLTQRGVAKVTIGN